MSGPGQRRLEALSERARARFCPPCAHRHAACRRASKRTGLAKSLLGTPERFLWERAALDGFSLVPLAWNRLEVHRALNMIGVGLAVFGVVGSWSDRRVRFALVQLAGASIAKDEAAAWVAAEGGPRCGSQQ